MASLTIRNIDDETKKLLRIRAARHGASLEEEVRGILRLAARQDDVLPTLNLYETVRALVEPYGGFELMVPERSIPDRDPPFLDVEE